jgi:signal transduction histidine kinase
VFQYVNRHQGNGKSDISYPKLTYKLGDLITWSRRGFSYSADSYIIVGSDTESETEVNQETDDSGLDGEELEVIQETADSESDSEEFADGAIIYHVYDGSGESESEGSTEIRLQSRLQEEFTPCNMDSLYDLELPEGLTFEQAAGYVEQAASDLSYNYDRYYKLQPYFSEGNNLKYMVVRQDGTITFTNLDAKVQNMEISELEEEFTKCGTYLVYDYGNNALEQTSMDMSKWVSYKEMLLDYAYTYQNKETLYIAVQTKNDAALGTWNEDDFYAVGAKRYEWVCSMWEVLLLGAIAAAIGALFLLVVFLILQPKTEKTKLRGFDRWFTEAAACFAFGSAGLVAFAGITLTDWLANENEAFSVALRMQCFVAGMFITFSLLYLLLLLYSGSLLRRIKARSLWTGSLLYYILHNIKRFFKKIENAVKKVAGLLVNNRLFIVRSLGPYILFVLLQPFALLPGLLVDSGGVIVFCLFLVFLIDVAVGVFLYQNDRAREKIVQGISRICDGEVEYQIDTERMYGENRVIAQAVNRIGEAVKNAVQISMKDERLKTDLITNVSHDIKTPLTSIINYVDLLKRENIPNEKAQEYIRILDEKSQRLKQLTLDLVEASKISSGNITLEMEPLNACELLKQAVGEYEDKFEGKRLQIMTKYPDEDKVMLYADSRRMWRILENLFTNIYKYAMDGTRVYVDLGTADGRIIIIIRNISAQPLNIPADELTQRFIRGDSSRSTEGSGLGLSIAKNLAIAQGGSFRIDLDGDLFKVTLEFPVYQEKGESSK